MRIMKCNSTLLMLDHFKKEHECTNRALIENGEGKRCAKWEDTSIPVKGIIEFMEYRIGKEWILYYINTDELEDDSKVQCPKCAANGGDKSEDKGVKFE